MCIEVHPQPGENIGWSESQKAQLQSIIDKLESSVQHLETCQEKLSFTQRILKKISNG